MRLSQSQGLGPLLALGWAVLPSQAALWDTIVQTEYGPVQGIKYFNDSIAQQYFNTSSLNVTGFLGIPYAADTSYQNRWKPAQPREPWNETLVADDFGPACPIAQTAGQWSLSEDCLSVNIWSPATSSSDKLPVMLWNYGSWEYSAETRYNAAGLATKGVVAVTYNYRDAAFGFLAHPELNAESAHNSSGNYGTLDQITALKWIQKNIANFGGDPEKVTVAGGSFGSAQAYHAVNSPLAKGLFRYAIAESGIRYPYDTLLAGLATSYHNMSRSIQIGLNYTSFHNVSTITQLRNLSMEQLMVGSTDRDYTIDDITALSTDYPPLFKSTLDGYVFPESYLASLLQGPANDVPLITGNNKDESGASLLNNYTLAEYKRYCSAKYGNLSEEYFKLYPAANDTQANRAWNAAARDTSLVTSWAFANGWIKSALSPFYTYYWDHAPPGQSQGAYHLSEVMYHFKGLFVNDYPWEEYDFYVAELMTSYWANFIKTGNPNLGDSYAGNGTLPPWAPNTGVGQTVMHLGDGWGNKTLTQEPAQVKLIMDYFAQQTPY